MIVLDASALLALLQDESGAEAVEAAVGEGAVISAVNLSEILAKMSDVGADVDAAADLIVSLFVEIVPFGIESARGSARIRRAVPGAGLSLGDRACLGLARARGLPTLTADRHWSRIGDTLEVDVRIVR